jgi:hypothetical protein
MKSIASANLSDQMSMKSDPLLSMSGMIAAHTSLRKPDLNYRDFVQQTFFEFSASQRSLTQEETSVKPVLVSDRD